MAFYGVHETWKIVYVPKVMNGGVRGVAFVRPATVSTLCTRLRSNMPVSIPRWKAAKN